MTNIVYGSPEQEKVVARMCELVKKHGGVPKIWRDSTNRLLVDVENTDASVKRNPFVVTEDGKVISKVAKLAGPPTAHRERPKKSKNSRCPCGSGSKYRKCCGKKEK